MKTQIALTAIAVLLGATYLSLTSGKINLQKQLTAPSYDIQLSRRYGAYAKIAYCPEDSVKNWTCKECAAHNQIADLHIISNPKRDLFGYAFYDTVLEKIVLVFRGTIDFKNEVNDFTYEKIPYTCRGCEVHLGFYEAHKAISKEVYEAVQTLLTKYPKAKVTSTGHSLGAALSTIAAIQINKKSLKLVTQLHNFGCPRIGNQKLAQFIKSQFPTMFRVIHDHDVFPHLPEQTQNYAHYPFEVLFDKNMTNYQVCDESGEDPTCSNSYSPSYNKEEHRFYFYPMNTTGC